MGKIISKTCLSQEEVCKTLNGFKEKKWNINNFFIQIVQRHGDVSIVYYDDILDSDPNETRYL